MQENSHLQKTLKAYEASLCEVDQATRKPSSEAELKKIIGTQTK